MKKFSYLLLFTLILIMSSATVMAAEYEGLPSKEVFKDHDFTIRFNKEIDSSSVSKESIYVLDKSLNKIDVELETSLDGKSIGILQKSVYVEGEIFTIYVKDIKSKSGETIKQNVKMDFKVVVNTTENKPTYALVKEMSDTKVIVTDFTRGRLELDYTDEWEGHGKGSIVIINQNGSLVNYDINDFIHDSIWDYNIGNLEFTTMGKRTLDSNVVIVIVDSQNNYVRSGTNSDLEQAASNESTAKAILDSVSKKIKLIVIEN